MSPKRKTSQVTLDSQREPRPQALPRYLAGVSSSPALSKATLGPGHSKGPSCLCSASGRPGCTGGGASKGLQASEHVSSFYHDSGLASVSDLERLPAAYRIHSIPTRKTTYCGTKSSGLRPRQEVLSHPGLPHCSNPGNRELPWPRGSQGPHGHNASWGS